MKRYQISAVDIPPKGITDDTERTAFLEGYGLTVIHIPNNEVMRNFRGVCEYIDAAVRQSLSQLR